MSRLERLPDGQRPLGAVFRDLAGDRPVTGILRDPEPGPDAQPPVNGRVFLALLFIGAIGLAAFALVVLGPIVTAGGAAPAQPVEQREMIR
jgi:hypothetical protein